MSGGDHKAEAVARLLQRINIVGFHSNSRTFIAQLNPQSKTRPFSSGRVHLMRLSALKRWKRLRSKSIALAKQTLRDSMIGSWRNQSRMRRLRRLGVNMLFLQMKSFWRHRRLSMGILGTYICKLSNMVLMSILISS
jgi:hypothetical protein